MIPNAAKYSEGKYAGCIAVSGCGDTNTERQQNSSVCDWRFVLFTLAYVIKPNHIFLALESFPPEALCLESQLSLYPTAPMLTPLSFTSPSTVALCGELPSLEHPKAHFSRESCTDFEISSLLNFSYSTKTSLPPAFADSQPNAAAVSMLNRLSPRPTYLASSDEPDA